MLPISFSEYYLRTGLADFLGLEGLEKFWGGLWATVHAIKLRWRCEVVHTGRQTSILLGGEKLKHMELALL